MKAEGGPGSDGHKEENPDHSSNPEEILVLDPKELIGLLGAHSHFLVEAADPELLNLFLHFFHQLFDVLKVGKLVFELAHVQAL